MSIADKVTLALGVATLAVAVLALVIAVRQLGKAAEQTAESARQTKLAAEATRATLWLEFRKLLADHADVHAKLRPGGAWYKNQKKGPDNNFDWVRAKSYMGLMEQCGKLLEEGLLDDATFNDLYKYRLELIVRNDAIRQWKLIKLASGWQDLLRLIGRAGISISSYNDRDRDFCRRHRLKLPRD